VYKWSTLSCYCICWYTVNCLWWLYATLDAVLWMSIWMDSSHRVLVSIVMDRYFFLWNYCLIYIMFLLYVCFIVWLQNILKIAKKNSDTVCLSLSSAATIVASWTCHHLRQETTAFQQKPTKVTKSTHKLLTERLIIQNTLPYWEWTQRHTGLRRYL